MKISNADGVEFLQAVTVPTASADGHAINKGQADDAYAPITQVGIPIPVTADWATGTNMLDDIVAVLGTPAECTGLNFQCSILPITNFLFFGQLRNDGASVAIWGDVTYGTMPTSGVAYLVLTNWYDI